MEGRHDATEFEAITLAGGSQPAVSVRAVLWVAELQGISLVHRGILLKLANHASQDGGGAYASVATIAKWAGLTPRSVRAILGRLLELGLIEVTGANGRNGGKRPTTYRVMIPAEFDPKNPPNAHGREEASFRGGRKPASAEPGTEPIPKPAGFGSGFATSEAIARQLYSPSDVRVLLDAGLPALRQLGIVDAQARSVLMGILKKCRQDSDRALSVVMNISGDLSDTPDLIAAMGVDHLVGLFFEEANRAMLQ